MSGPYKSLICGYFSKISRCRDKCTCFNLIGAKAVGGEDDEVDVVVFEESWVLGLPAVLAEFAAAAVGVSAESVDDVAETTPDSSAVVTSVTAAMTMVVGVGNQSNQMTE